jgi:hypothetical protein
MGERLERREWKRTDGKRAVSTHTVDTGWKGSGENETAIAAIAACDRYSYKRSIVQKRMRSARLTRPSSVLYHTGILYVSMDCINMSCSSQPTHGDIHSRHSTICDTNLLIAAVPVSYLLPRVLLFLTT